MANQVFHFSNTGVSSGQRFYLKDDVSRIFVRNLILDSNSSISGNNLVYNNGDQTISGIKNFVDNVYIKNLFVTGAETIVSTTNFNVQSPYLLLNLTGGALDGGIFFVTGAGLTGINDYGPIIGFDHSLKFKFGVARRSDDLNSLNDIASVQSVDSLSGYINSTSSNIVYTTGDQTIGGIKTFSSVPVFNNGADLNNKTLVRAVPSVVSTATAPALTDTDHNGRVIYMTNSIAATITIPAGLSAGFNCSIIQGGGGSVTIATGAGVTLNSYLSSRVLAGIYATVSIVSVTQNNYIMYGNTL